MICPAPFEAPDGENSRQIGLRAAKSIPFRAISGAYN